MRGNRLIVRYTPNERTNHWITAITFILLALSGLAMFHPAMSWLYALLGGGQWTRILHPFVGCVMFLSFLILALRFWHHNYLDQSDIQWMRQIDDVLNNREEKLPAIGKYNAGQKLLFFTMVMCLLAAAGQRHRDLAAVFLVLFSDRDHSPGGGCACGRGVCSDRRNRRAYLCGVVDQRIDRGDDARHRDVWLGEKASSEMVQGNRSGSESDGKPEVHRAAAFLHSGRTRRLISFQEVYTVVQRILEAGDIESLDQSAIPRIRTPERATVFLARATRLRQLAARSNPIAGYLRLMAALADAQHAALSSFKAVPPSQESIASAQQHSMPLDSCAAPACAIPPGKTF